MKLTRLELSDVCLIENDIFQDERGSLSEVYKDHMIYEKLGFTNLLELEVESVKGVLRGLHYQLDPHAQAKIVRVVNGSILDVVVDIRRSSKTFGKWCSNVLDSEKKQQLYVPRGFAHGYYTLEPNTKLIYKLDNLYSREAFRGIAYNDVSLDINWGLIGAPTLSEQDRILPKLSETEVFE
jgi:dTDP-4-dehydrorhamnose 3,5-epimerase